MSGFDYFLLFLLLLHLQQNKSSLKMCFNAKCVMQFMLSKNLYCITFFFLVARFRTSHTRFIFIFSLSKLFTMGDTIDKRTKFVEEDGINKHVYIFKARSTFNVSKNNNVNLFITNNNK